MNEYDNRLDYLLTALANGETIDDNTWESLNRLEQFLVCIITGKEVSELGEPLNRLEALLIMLCNSRWNISRKWKLTNILSILA